MKRLMAEKADQEEKIRAAASIKTKKLEEKFTKNNKAEWVQIKKQQAKDKKEDEKLEKKEKAKEEKKKAKEEKKAKAEEDRAAQVEERAIRPRRRFSFWRRSSRPQQSSTTP